MKKILSVFLITILMLTAFSACGKEKTVILLFAVRSAAGSFDPQIAAGPTTKTVVRNCFEGLTARDENGELCPGAAQSWQVSADRLTYTFTIRSDANWHLTKNASEQLGSKLPENFDLSVTADDFVFALRRAVDPATGAPDAYMLMNIAGAAEIRAGKADPETLGVTAVDSHTLQIRLARPQSNFPEVLAEPVAMPCNRLFFNACTGRYGTYIKYLLSNGPFYLSYFDERSYRITKNDDYKGEHPSKAQVCWFYPESDREQVLEDLAADKYAGAYLTAAEYETLKTNRHMTVKKTDNLLRSLIFNVSDAALKNPDLRRAFTSATDPSLIAANGGRPLVRGYVPLAVASELVTTHPVSYNENNAGIYLKKAYASLGTDSVTLTVLCETAHEELMRKLLQEWQRILGITVNLSVRSVSAAELSDSVENGNYQIAFYPVKADTGNVFEYFGDFTPSGGGNVTGYTTGALTSLTDALYSADDAFFVKTYGAIEKKLADASVMIPVWSESSYFVCTKGVSGVVFGTGEDKLYTMHADEK